MNAEELWRIYTRKNPNVNAPYQAWAFGCVPEKLAALVLSGKKVGTASVEALYGIEKEPIPKVGDYSVILEKDGGDAVGIIRTVKVTLTPFGKVGAEHAAKEGEGDLSLDYWRRVHREVFTEELAEYGIPFDENVIVVCEEFELLLRASDVR